MLKLSSKTIINTTQIHHKPTTDLHQKSELVQNYEQQASTSQTKLANINRVRNSSRQANTDITLIEKFKLYPTLNPIRKGN